MCRRPQLRNQLLRPLLPEPSKADGAPAAYTATPGGLAIDPRAHEFRALTIGAIKHLFHKPRYAARTCSFANSSLPVPCRVIAPFSTTSARPEMLKPSTTFCSTMRTVTPLLPTC